MEASTAPQGETTVYTQPSVIMSFLRKIYDMVAESYKLLKLIAEKHRVSTNPLMLEYGSYASLENGKLEIDSDGIHAALIGCKNIQQVIAHLPFIGLTENGNKLACEFCPSVELIYYPCHNQTSQKFGNTKNVILKHVTSLRHEQAVLKDYQSNQEDKEILSKDKQAGMAVFRVVYGGMKMGHSLQKIIREFAVLQFHGVVIGNINHSDYTIRKIKDVLAATLRKRLRVKLGTPLEATGKLRPISELFDKMTHFSKVSYLLPLL